MAVPDEIIHQFTLVVDRVTDADLQDILTGASDGACIIECTEKFTGVPRYLICLTHRAPDGNFHFHPVGEMFTTKRADEVFDTVDSPDSDMYRSE